MFYSIIAQLYQQSRYTRKTFSIPSIKRAKLQLFLEPLEERTVPSILGSADSFAILAGSSVASTGATAIAGDVGVSPGVNITGFPSGLVSGGTLHANDAAAVQAESNVTSAYNALATESFTTDLSGHNLGGMTLTPGVYHFSADAQLTGVLTLDAQGNPNARFDFQIAGTLTVAANSSVQLINSANGDNVYWQVGNSVSLGSAAVFDGNILAHANITLANGAAIADGRALACTGIVSLDANNVSNGRADAGGTITGCVFNDLNDDGTREAGESGWAGVTVELDATVNGIVDSDVDSTITDALGNYTFSNLSPGIYTVHEVVPSGWALTTPPPQSYLINTSGVTQLDNESIHFVSVASGNADTITFDGQQLSVISGQYEIQVSDGQSSTSDFLTLCVDLSHEVADGDVYAVDATSGASSIHNWGQISYLYDHYGQTLLSNDDAEALQWAVWTLEYGSKFVPDATRPAEVFSMMNFYLTQAVGQNETAIVLDSSLGGTVTGEKQSLLAPSSSVTGVCFGNYQLSTAPPASTTGSISGEKFNDLTGSGVQETSDPSVAGVTIYLDTNNNGVLDSGERSTVTDVNGDYSFSNLAPGTYTVREVVPAGWTETTPAAQTVVINTPGLTSTQDETLHFNQLSSGNNDTITYDGQQISTFSGQYTVQVTEPNGSEATFLTLCVDLPHHVTVGDSYSVDASSGASTIQNWGQISYLYNHYGQAPLSNDDAEALQWAVWSLEYGSQFTPDPSQPADVLTMMNFYLSVSAGKSESAVLLDASLDGTVTNHDQNFLSPIGSVAGVNIGNFQLGTISGEKFNDLNGSGTLEPGDPGIAGVTFVLDSDQNGTLTQVMTTTSGSNGDFTFTGVGPGTYVVREVVPSGWTQTTPNPAPIVMTSGGDITGLDFGDFQLSTAPPASATGSISGEKFNDLTGSGVQETSDPGVAGVTIYLDTNNNGVLDSGEPSTVTDASGNYSFSNLAPGTYTVREVVPAGWTETTPAAQTVVITTDGLATTQNQTLDFIKIAAGMADTITFDGKQESTTSGQYEISVSDGQSTVDVLTLCVDLNHGVAVGDSYLVDPTSGTTSIQNWGQISYLYDHYGQTLLSNDDAESLQWAVWTLEYGSKFTPDPSQPADVLTMMNFYLSVSAGKSESAVLLDASLGGTVSNHDQNFLAPIGSVTGVNIGNFQLGTISGEKFNDLNGSGILDQGDSGVSGVTFVLESDKNGTLVQVASTTSDSNGDFSFTNVGPGTYVVREVVPPGWTQTTPNPAPIVVTSGSDVSGLNFGDFQLGTISGEKFNDLNDSGTLKPGDPGISGVTFVLDSDNNGTLVQVASTTSDSDGDFIFTGVGAGTYVVREVVPSGWMQTTSNPASFTISSGSDVTGLLIGDMQIVAPSSPTPPGGSVLSSSGSSSPSANAILVVSAYETASSGNVLAASGTAPNLAAISKTQLFGSNLSGLGSDPSGSSNSSDSGSSSDPLYVFDANTGALKFTIDPYPTFGGAVRVAVGDLEGDGVPDIITAPGPGGGPDIHIYNGETGALIRTFMAFSPNFTGGVYVAAGDVTGSGHDDIIVGADAGGGPNVIVFDGKTGSVIANFMAFDPNFTGGVRVAAGDLFGNGQAEVVVGAGPGGGPQVKVFNVMTGQVLESFFAFDPDFTGGVYVAVGDTSGTGQMNIVTGAGAGGGPSVDIFDGATGAPLQGFYAFNPAFQGGVRVTTELASGDSTATVFAVPGPGAGAGADSYGLNSAAVDPYLAMSPDAIDEFFAAGSQ